MKSIYNTKPPLYYDDRVKIKTQIEKIGTKSMIVHQFIYRENDKTLCNQARFVLVCVENGFQSTPIPSNLINAFQKGPVTPVQPPEK
ncbi:MAG: thioesterase family protein [Thermodesulfobacteriota bacterium]|nr:thioesterase family protein [Thermodesulfobacteriota bacterium]